MSFSEEVQNQILDSFAMQTGVPSNAIKCSVVDSDAGKKITLEAVRTESNGESCTTNLVIEDLRGKYRFVGKVESPQRSLQIDKIITTTPRELACAVKQVLVMARVVGKKNPNLMNKISNMTKIGRYV